MLGQYLPMLALFGLAVLFAAGSFLASGLLAPRNPTAAKQAAYECGIVPTKETPERFPVKFFLVAMIFIVFDIEIIFFYPYAIANGGLGIFGLVTIMVFTFAVCVAVVAIVVMVVIMVSSLCGLGGWFRSFAAGCADKEYGG